MDREYETGKHVIFVDPHGIPRDALVTIWHCTDDREDWMKTGQETCCNLIWVSGDEKRKDTYGRQTVRESSVVHQGSQPAHGNFWRWPDE